jgi:hypothetical protein
MPSPDLQTLLDRLRAEGRLRPPPTQAEVRGRVHAYLLQRGRHLATDQGLSVDLDHVQDDDLIRLAELDCIAQHPTLSPRLACTLEMVASERDHDAVYTPQDLARLRELKLDLGRSPDDVPLFRPEIREDPSANGLDQGQDGSRARAVRKLRGKKKTTMEKILAESRDEIDFGDD